MMRTVFLAATVLIGWTFGTAQTVATIAGKAGQVYDRIRSFSADAWVYEYYG